ncbi:unnamed protein product [Leptidea sinapis]|uniref:Uncharacterized protein n=1 Tax=Leptidea sinapis TaxID=189913 RepID=A0A5E4PQ14_9NEOP|nr:unnamed protein product [Leptidea sinapis]
MHRSRRRDPLALSWAGSASRRATRWRSRRTRPRVAARGAGCWSGSEDSPGPSAPPAPRRPRSATSTLSGHQHGFAAPSAGGGRRECEVHAGSNS